VVVVGRQTVVVVGRQTVVVVGRQTVVVVGRQTVVVVGRQTVVVVGETKWRNSPGYSRFFFNWKFVAKRDRRHKEAEE
jgi:hypothetical protein